MTTHSSILAGEFHGQSKLVGYRPWGHKESACLFFHSSGGQDSKTVSFKISVSRATFFLEALGGNLFSCHFRLVDVACILGSWVP